jgi:hypothetical protein
MRLRFPTLLLRWSCSPCRTFQYADGGPSIIMAVACNRVQLLQPWTNMAYASSTACILVIYALIYVSWMILLLHFVIVWAMLLFPHLQPPLQVQDLRLGCQAMLLPLSRKEQRDQPEITTADESSPDLFIVVEIVLSLSLSLLPSFSSLFTLI